MTHWIFNRATSRLKGYAQHTGKLLLDVPAHNETVETVTRGSDFFGHFGACPPGEYQLGLPQQNVPPTVAEYTFFIPLVDVNRLWDAEGRSEIGLHAGGTGSPAPLDGTWQGAWIPTEGCFRLRNGDLLAIVRAVTPGDPFSVV